MRRSDATSVAVVSAAGSATAAFDEMTVHVVETVDEAVERLDEFDGVILAAEDAGTFLEATGDDTGVPVIVLTDGDTEFGGERENERVRSHPASAHSTLEQRVLDAVLADRERNRHREQCEHSHDELKEREAAYRTLVNNIPNGGVSLFDRELRYTWVGGEVFDQLGLDPEEVHDHAIQDVHSERFVEQYGDDYAGVFDGDRAQFRFSYAGRVFESDVVPVREDGEVTAGMTLTRDVTDEVEHQRDLLIKTRAMDAAAIGLVLTDPTQEGNPLVYVNEGYERMTGYDAAEVLGKNPRHLQGPETEAEPKRRMRESVANAEPSAVNITNYRKDGTPFINHVEITPIFDRDGELAHFLGSQVDVTEQAERERRLARQNEQLEEFASIVSHDLRSPLAVVEGSLKLASKTGDVSNLDRASQALERMDELIGDLLTLAREGRTVDDERIETVSLATVAREAWNTVDTGEATLTVDTDRSVKADQSRLRQLFANLFRNAVEHGGKRTLEVRLDGLEDGGFAVEDDGVGVPPERRAAVFEAGVTGSDSGTGFGLSIVESVAEAHGWTVSLTESAEGGARFEFRVAREDSAR